MARGSRRAGSAETEARETMDTRPRDADIVQPQLGLRGWLRWAWRSLTSMRTALFLLLLLAVAAVPGSVFPQRNIDAGKVADYITANPRRGEWLDRFGFFDVYSSPWFSAVYLLLMISLVGCIVPRTRLHWRAARGLPPRAPKRLERLPAHESVTVEMTADEALARAREVLKGRVHAHDDSSLSSETGLLRETGNIVFHLALTGIIVGMAVGHLLGWRADVIVQEGQGFSSTVGSYDTFAPGPLVDSSVLPAFSLTLDSMNVKFETTPGARQMGQPREFSSKVTISEPGRADRQEPVAVNAPLNVQGSDIFLLGNGYAPEITVRDATGKVIFKDAVPFLPMDGNYRSQGVVKMTAAQPKQLGMQGFFLPTAEPTFAQGPRSLFPDALSPEIAVSIWEGTLFPGARPQSVYTLNTSMMTQLKKADGTPVLIRLKPGESYTLPDGRGTVTLDGVKRWAGLSVRHAPGQGIVLVSALAAVAGLIASLLVKRRRIFVRVAPADGPDGSSLTVVTIGGLTRSADPGLAPAVKAVRDHIAEGKTHS